jgi:hypothetical protein
MCDRKPSFSITHSITPFGRDRTEARFSMEHCQAILAAQRAQFLENAQYNPYYLLPITPTFGGRSGGCFALSWRMKYPPEFVARFTTTDHCCALALSLFWSLSGSGAIPLPIGCREE